MALMKRKEWLAERATGLGGSDAAAVCGCSPWATPLDVYWDKVGYLDGLAGRKDEETADMRRGTLLEPAVLQLYTDETGIIVRKPEAAMVSEQYPFMRANLDGLAVDQPLVIEAKTARFKVPPGGGDVAKRWGDPWTAEIPLVYLFQVQHNMVVSKLDVCHVPVLFGDFDFAVYEVPADREFQELMIAEEERFWRMVEARTPPDPINDADVSKRWPISRPTQRKATQDALEIGGHLLAVREYFKKLEAFKESLEAELKRLMEEDEELVAGNEVICSWKTAKGRSMFDAKKFQAEHPDLYAQYAYQGAPSRRFLFKDKAAAVQIFKPMLQESLLPDRKLLGGKK
jgi:putative phage-type endonuclease